MSNAVFDSLAALLIGLSEGLPVSSSGNLAFVEVVSGRTPSPEVSPLSLVSAGLVLFVSARPRFGVWFRRRQSTGIEDTEGAISSPREALPLLLIALSGIPGALLLQAMTAGMAHASMAVAAGLVGTTVMLFSSLFAPRGRPDLLTFDKALAVGLCQAFAGFPGVSGTAAAFTSLVWVGIGRKRAVPLAFLVVGPRLCAAGIHAWLRSPEPLHLGAASASVIALAAAGAALGAYAFRKIAEPRLPHTVGYLATIGTALFAFSWAVG